MMELVTAASMGDETALSELWEMVYRLGYKILLRYQVLCRHGAISVEDLKQESYITFLSAVRNYKITDKCSFTTYFGEAVRNMCRRVLGLERGKYEHQQNMLSLDVPLCDDADATLIDVLPDPNAPTEDEIVDALSAAHDVREAMSKLPSIESAVIWHTFFNQMTFAQAGAELGLTVNEVRRIRHLALCHLRKDAELRMRCPSYISHTGLQYFKDTWTSSVENAAILRERLLIERNNDHESGYEV